MTFSVRENLISDLKGKTIRICDIGNILPGWPEGINPEIEKLRDHIEAWLDTYEHSYPLLFNPLIFWLAVLAPA